VAALLSVAAVAASTTPLPASTALSGSGMSTGASTGGAGAGASSVETASSAADVTGATASPIVSPWAQAAVSSRKIAAATVTGTIRLTLSGVLVETFTNFSDYPIFVQFHPYF
jgi:hypothetical protein